MIIKNKEGKIIFDGADLSEAYLSGANLRRADLSEADLSGADLRRADLSEADLIGANLREADLSGADLSGADLIGANLREANLRGADLREANLREANLKYQIITGSCHTCIYLTEINQLQIGCEIHPLSWWKKNYNECGIEHEYTEKQIEEYRKYIEELK